MTSSMLPEPESKWPRTLRALAFWIVMVVGSIALVQYASNRRQEAVDISYNQFVEQLDHGNIAVAEIIVGGRVTGYFKSPVAVRGRAMDHFTMVLPFTSSEPWVASLIAKGVDLRGREEKESFGVFLFSFLPYLLIFGLLVVMLRRQRKARSGAEIRSSAPRTCHSSTTKAGVCDTRQDAVECP